MIQNKMSPELLWQLGRITALGITLDKKNIVYKVNIPSVHENKQYTKHYFISINGGNPTEIEDPNTFLNNKKISPDGKYILSHKEVKLQNVLGKDFYPELDKSEVQIYDSLNYRHWDTWNEGKYYHVFYSENKKEALQTDIMPMELFDCPTKPFGGDEDYIWSPDSKSILYVCKKKQEQNMPFQQIAIFSNTILKRQKPLTLQPTIKVMM